MSSKHLTLSVILALLVIGHAQLPAQPLIAHLGTNGDLVVTNLSPSTAATIQWSPTATGPWSENWDSLQDVIADSHGAVHVKVPMFFQVRVSNPDPERLIWIPPGAFTQGSPTNEFFHVIDEVQHPVTITHGFWIGRHEVTQSEFTEIIGTNPSAFLGANLPVDSITWSDATNYCARRTEHERTAGRLPPGYVYRLPTEAEWEYACRAGTSSAFHYGAALVTGLANFYGLQEYVSSVGPIQNSNGVNLARPTPIESYTPNAWGIYDLHGNAWEWCRDWFGDYPTNAVNDPLGPNMGTYKILRGGSWLSDGSGCRTALRSGRFPGVGDTYVGMRVVLGIILP
jgi:formylglycine-generating enzyme required for sulfatase activity